MHIALITYDGLPDLDPDDCLLKDELVKRGHEVSACIWDDDSIDWSEFDLSIMRSAWDYHLKIDQFYSWMDRIVSQTRLLNPAPIMKWSSHKSYLRELSQAGLPVVETIWVEKGGTAKGLFEKLDWRQTIVKPAVGLATFGVKKFTLNQSGKPGDSADSGKEQAQLHADQLAQSVDVMIQPFHASVDDYGERALIFLDGEFSHTVRKSSFQILAPAGHAGETSVPADEQEVAVARKIIDFLPEKPLYARVDLVRDSKANPLVLELELVEPSLFISCQPSAAIKFADALERGSDLHKV